MFEASNMKGFLVLTREEIEREKSKAYADGFDAGYKKGTNDRKTKEEKPTTKAKPKTKVKTKNGDVAEFRSTISATDTKSKGGNP